LMALKNKCEAPMLTTTDVKPPTVKVVSLEEIESMLAKTWGRKLEPIKQKKQTGFKPAERISVYNHPIQPSNKIYPTGRVKMKPDDLNAMRLKELIDQGKKLDDIVGLYNFKNKACLRRKINDLGCGALIQLGRPKKE